MTDPSQSTLRRNVALLGLDYITFGIAMTILGPTTILPSFVRLLGGGPLAVGSLAAIQSGGWLLPQLLASRYVTGRPLVKKFIVVPAATGRTALALLLPFLWLFSVQAPRPMLVALLLVMTCFWVADAVASVGWFDLVAKSTPAEQRGRLIGVAQSLTSLLSIGVGVVVRAILARPDPFPSSYVLLFLIAAVTFGVGVIALGLVREPPGVSQSQAMPPWRDYLPRLKEIVRTDPRFSWVTVTRWLAGFADMSGAFYILFATDRLHIPQEMIGLFISAGVAGGLLSGITLGPLSDRKGCAHVIAVIMGIRCLSPILALCAPLVAGYHPWLAPAAFMLIFAGAGMANSAHMIGFMNYLLQIAPPGDRPVYMGLGNTLNGVLLVGPLIAGWLVATISYEFLFLVTLGLGALGLLITLRGPGLLAPRQAPQPSSPC